MAGGLTYHTESAVDIVGNVKVRVWVTNAQGQRVAFQLATSLGASGTRGGRHAKQDDLAAVLAKHWTQAAFEVLAPLARDLGTHVHRQQGRGHDASHRCPTRAQLNAGDTGVGPLSTSPTPSTPPTSRWCPATPSPSPRRGLAGHQHAGAVGHSCHGYDLDRGSRRGGHGAPVQPRRLAGESLEAISAALAASINADTSDTLVARADGVAPIVVNTAGKTPFSTTFAIGPATTVVTPDPVQTWAKSVVLSGTPVAGDTWTVNLSFNDGSGQVTSTQPRGACHRRALRSRAGWPPASTPPAGLHARVNGNTLVVDNRRARLRHRDPHHPAGETAGSFTRAVVSPTSTRLTLNGTAAIGERPGASHWAA